MAAAKEQSKDVNMTQKGTGRDDMPLDRVQETIKDCNFCCGDHDKGKCPTWGKKCPTCGGKGHAPTSKLCKGKKKKNAGQGGGQARNQRGGANSRGGGASGRNKGRDGQQQQSGTPQPYSKTVFRREGNQWIKKRQTVSYLEEDADSEDSASEYEFEANRLDVNKLGPTQEPTTIGLTPTENAKYRTKVPWTTDTGVLKTLLSEKHFWKIMDHNPDVKLRHTKIRFRPYSTKAEVPLLGKMKVKLTNNNGYQTNTTVYVTKGQTESLLGREDAIDLGIIQINPDRRKPQQECSARSKQARRHPHPLKEPGTSPAKVPGSSPSHHAGDPDAPGRGGRSIRRANPGRNRCLHGQDYVRAHSGVRGHGTSKSGPHPHTSKGGSQTRHTGQTSHPHPPLEGNNKEA